MASYDFTDRGSTTFGKGRLGSRVPAWDTPNSTDLGNVTKSERPQDHVCRPVIVNADGTMTPGIVFLPQQNQQQKETDSLVSKIDKEAEHVYAPLAAAHGHTSAAHNGRSKPVGQLVDKANPFNEASSNVQTASTRTGFSSGMFQRQTPNSYGGTNHTSTNAWGRPSGGTYDTITNGWSRSGDGTYRSGTDGWSKLDGGTYDTGSNGWGRSGDRTYDTGSKGWSRSGDKTYDTGSNGWSRSGDRTYDTGSTGWSRSGDGSYESGTNGWGKPTSGTYDTRASGWGKPGGTTLHQTNFNGSRGRYESATNNGWGKPNHVSWATPTSYEIPPTKTTNDVDSAVDYLRESIGPQSITMAPRQGRFSASSPTYPTRETVLETIDSREASRRYGNSTASPQTIQEIYSTTIDSREAARKYSGSFV
ncbi:uncharacterized protein LOC131231666 isoform X1 [Magnolia sinica]|uniref:uncharacterized protein LOC131231666 isoform X1 n=1 Tax=Magnolia sinica TaxID=86752 RepID=UPI0026588837|nr:uncharacterized protein LOC131231666 isoform X1 [Magnolia sinica]